MKKIFWFGTGCMILALLCLGIFLLTGSGSTHYYTQVDSRRPAQGKPRNGVIDLKGGMDYYYTLTAWDENGRKKEITFGTSRHGAKYRMKNCLRRYKANMTPPLSDSASSKAVKSFT